MFSLEMTGNHLRAAPHHLTLLILLFQKPENIYISQYIQSALAHVQFEREKRKILSEALAYILCSISLCPVAVAFTM